MHEGKDAYAAWRERLRKDGIWEDGVIDRKKLEEQYPQALTDEQISWIEGPFHIGQTLRVEYDGGDGPVTMTVTDITHAGVHLLCEEDDSVEYLADPKELMVMIVE